MARNTSFAVALHALSVLAFRGELTKSDFVAQSVNTNAVVVRRIMSKLVQAGLVRSVAGKNGGFELARDAAEISIDEVFEAVGEQHCFAIHENTENPACAVSCGIKDALGDVLERVDAAVARELGKTTLADVVARVS